MLILGQEKRNEQGGIVVPEYGQRWINDFETVLTKCGVFCRKPVWDTSVEPDEHDNDCQVLNCDDFEVWKYPVITEQKALERVHKRIEWRYSLFVDEGNELGKDLNYEQLCVLVVHKLLIARIV